MQTKQSFILGISLLLGLTLLGYILGSSIIHVKELERTVSVKGLAEKEVKADRVLWPIVYLSADNDQATLYAKLEQDTLKITNFLKEVGFSATEIRSSAPSITDKMAQGYGGSAKIKYRYSATQTLTLYTDKVDLARKSMREIAKLGKAGITFRSNAYDYQTEFIYTKLNEIKPTMIEQATQNARSSALKFAEDSKSKLGKIKKARQGQFSINSRDKYTPEIKKIRVVSTVEYYLND